MSITYSVVGLGKLGASMVAAIASRGYNVIGVDINQHAVDLLAAGRAPVQETELEDTIAANRFLGTFRYLLVLGTVFNQLKWAFLMITIVSNVRWPVLFLVNTKCVDERPSKLAVIELFRKFLITS